MPIVSSCDSEQWPMFLRVNRRRRRATSSKSGGIRCIAGCNSIRRREVSRRSHAGNMRHGNWTMPLWLSISPTIPTPRWRNWGKCLRSVSWRFGKPDKACGLLEKKTLLYAERDEPARAQFQDELADLDPNELVYLDESEVDEARIAPMLVRHAAQR